MEVITDYGTFLREAKSAVQELDRMKEQQERLARQLKQDQKALEAGKKQVEDAIAQTTKKRKNDITAGYDKELSKGQERLKKARSKREKAKSQGVKERIVEETADLRDDNRRIRLQIRTLFQQEHVPAFCNTGWYYALYFPRWPGEFLQLAAAVLVCFLLIPYGIYAAIPAHGALYLALVYFVCAVGFGGLYVVIGNRTRDRCAQALKEGRQLRDEMRGNNLEKYDDEIAQIEQSMKEMAAKKKDALNAFETVTRNIIADEITEGSREKLESMKRQCEEEEKQLKELENAVKDQNLHITDCYGSYIAREFLTPEKLDELADRMQNGTASSLSEAMEQLKKNAHNQNRPGL